MIAPAPVRHIGDGSTTHADLTRDRAVRKFALIEKTADFADQHGRKHGFDLS
jgi:hypothetical protein